MVVKVQCGTHFQHGGKFVPQNSPAMYFDNHLDLVSHATSKWRIRLTVMRIENIENFYTANQPLTSLTGWVLN